MSKLTLTNATRTFIDRFSVSAESTRSGRRAIPGGYSRSSFNFGPHAIFVDRGDGAYLTTVDGHRLLDLNNNFTVNVLGHAHPAIEAALIEAIPTGISFGNPVDLEARLADLLIERIPSVEKVQFSCSATESCMSAVRLARAFTGRTKIAKMEGGYHGFSDALHVSAHFDANQNAGPDDAPIPFPESRGIPQNAVDDVIVLTQNDLEGAARILRANADDVACVIMELETGAGGPIRLDESFVEGLRELTSELGIVLIFDETITLRAGFHGLQGEYGVTPDLTVMGKIIGGGLPLGAVGGRTDILDLLDDGRVTISGTHHGHKLSLAAGIACLEALQPSVFDRLNAQAHRIMTDLNEWSAAHSGRLLIHGYGYSHLAYAYLAEPGLQMRTHRDYARKLDGEATQTISLELANRGYFPVHRGEISLSVPMTDDDITGFTETMKDIVSDIEG